MQVADYLRHQGPLRCQEPTAACDRLTTPKREPVQRIYSRITHENLDGFIVKPIRGPKARKHDSRDRGSPLARQRLIAAPIATISMTSTAPPELRKDDMQTRIRRWTKTFVSDLGGLGDRRIAYHQWPPGH